MKIAVIADIHGNLEAFTNVLGDIESQQIEAVISLGDNIGYGADSEQIIQQIRTRNIISIMGNHEHAISNPKVRAWFTKDAQKALDQARASLSEGSKDYICSLQKSLRLYNCLFVHGFPPDSTRFYLFQISDAKLLKTFDEMEESICFVGHTHKLRLVYLQNGIIHSQTLESGLTRLNSNQKYIINAGSVGQPRDGDPNAKYLIWDSSTDQLETRSIPYDVETAAKKIVAAGIPVKFARRLEGTIL